MSRPPAPRYCAICGTELSPNARACPNCGADERTGWREQDPADGLDLPPDEEDFAAAHSRFLTEIGHEARKSRNRLKHVVIVTITACLVLAFLASMFLLR
ncbi:zinc-ribbon domain-containing protein [Ereboglobus luteus]|uniref:Zinc-ribbon domain-containing protein n=1 Tax=Ereboglobus luteus TaxID=1796921 RepID=A0A2U8E2F1_9BACT|nr:zinc-ribbon domain-containing protein [Ereboglobus luteus]AWI09047.1 hypothetical protein CKA38_07160 [Ereboglobus luteus]